MSKTPCYRPLLCLALSVSLSVSHAQTDTPCNAPIITVNTDTCIFLDYSTAGATYQTDVANGGVPPCAFPGAPDVWFAVIVPPSGALAITTEPGTITDGGMALYDGPCSAPQFIECDDDAAVGFMPVIDRSDFTPGDTVYIRFWKAAGPGTGSFHICAVLAHSDCRVAIPVCHTFHVDGTPYGPGSVQDEFANFCDISEFQSEWFRFHFLTSGTFTFMMYPDPIGGGIYPDLDWLLFHANDTAFCATHTVDTAPYACNGSSSYGALGQTGLDPAGTSNSVPAGPGNPYCPVLTVNAGDMYYLFVNNYTTSSTGFNMLIGGTAVLDCGGIDLGFTSADPGLPRFLPYPVPASDEVSIPFTPECAVVELYDALGRSVSSMLMTSHEPLRIPLSGRASGIYQLRGLDRAGRLIRVGTIEVD